MHIMVILQLYLRVVTIFNCLDDCMHDNSYCSVFCSCVLYALWRECTIPHPVVGGRGETGDQLKRLPHKLAPVTLSSLKQRLLNQLKDLTEVNSDHQQTLSTASEDLKTYSQDVEQFEDRTSVLAGDYKFYQETRAYLRNLLGCLGEKHFYVHLLDCMEL